MKRTWCAGFTLIELMIVVAIIGILASIAIPNFVQYQLRAKRGEGSIAAKAIFSAEVAYHGTSGFFVSAADLPRPMAGAGTDASKQAWCDPGTCQGFDSIGFRPEGAVFFSYNAGFDAANQANEVSVWALGNVDGDGELSGYCYRTAIGGNTNVTDCPSAAATASLPANEQLNALHMNTGYEPERRNVVY